MAKEHFVLSTILKKAELLNTEELPPRILYRDSEIKATAQGIIRRNNTLLYGATGIGKTAVVRYVIKEYPRYVPPPLNTIIFLQCNRRPTPYKLLITICETLGMELGYRPDKERMIAGISKHKNLIIVLDEFEQIKDFPLFVKWITDMQLPAICITNDPVFTSTLTSEITSRLGFSVVKFEPYTPQQVSRILWDRIRKGALHKGTCTKGAIDRLSAKIVKNEDGNIRIAIKVVKGASLVAEREASKTITDEIIDIAVEEVRCELLEGAISKLSDDNKLILLALGSNTLLSGDLYERYKTLAGDHACAYTTFWRRLNELDYKFSLISLHDKKTPVGQERQAHSTIPRHLFEQIAPLICSSVHIPIQWVLPNHKQKKLR